MTYTAEQLKKLSGYENRIKEIISMSPVMDNSDLQDLIEGIVQVIYLEGQKDQIKSVLKVKKINNMGILEYEIQLAQLSAKIDLLIQAEDRYKSKEDQEYIKKELKEARDTYNNLVNDNIPF